MGHLKCLDLRVAGGPKFSGSRLPFSKQALSKQALLKVVSLWTFQGEKLVPANAGGSVILSPNRGVLN